MHPYVDLRSDTVTRPTPAMLKAMAEAPVGDDVLGDDPTVAELERCSAHLLRKEAALFVPSGTMGNNIAINVHTRHGDEILCDWDSHSMCYEVGAPSALSGVQTRPYRAIRGVPDPAEISEMIHEPSLHGPGTSLILVENTHNRHGGAVVPLEVMRELYALAKYRGVNIHLDGARIFNAAVATDVPAREFAGYADSVCFCLSKGLGCPVGSLLCGTYEFIEKARRARKRFGGGMRQVGILAACGLVALDSMIDRLAEDHVNARKLAQGICDAPGITVDLDAVQTNMVYIDTVGQASTLVERLSARGVLFVSTAQRRIRFVTHHDVDEEDIVRAIAAIHETGSA
jgi:threonine aldolase